MKRFNSVGLLVLGIFLLSLFSGLTIAPVDAATMRLTEFQVTTNPAEQSEPAIYGYNIVYQDNRNGNWDIYLFKLLGAFEPESRITTDSANQMYPKIFGDIVVYMDDRNGNWDIYMYNIATQTETQLTTNAATQEYPAIYNTRVVYQDNRNGGWDIYMYDLTTKTESRISSDGVAEQYPDIYGNRIVYQFDGFAGEVFMNDLSTSSLTRVGIQSPWFLIYDGLGNPAVSGDYVAYQGTKYETINVWENYDIYLYHAPSNSHLRLTSDYLIQNEPDIDGNYVVWQGVVWRPDLFKYEYNIYLYRIYEQSITQITTDSANQMHPAVNGGRIVYVDDRNGNWDIYLTEVSYYNPPIGGMPPELTEYAIRRIENIKNTLADPSQIPPSDLSGVKDNTRNAMLNKLDSAIANVQAGADATNVKKQIASFQSAIDQLNAILEKTDGYMLRGAPDNKGSGFTPDWITTSASQELIDPLIRGAINTIQALLDSD